MSLHSEIDDLQVFYEHVPRDEAETRERILYPLLKAAGYSTRQILSEKYDQSRQRPDYTITASDGEDGVWYLEAKAWRVQLEDAQVSQALNYANQNGKRWVVLSNGQYWRLYDNDVKGLPEKKLVCQAELRDQAAMEELLTVLSPAGFAHDRIGHFAEQQRAFRAERELDEVVLSAISSAFNDSGHPVSIAISGALSTPTHSISPERVSKILRSHFTRATSAPVTRLASTPSTVVAMSEESYDAFRQGVEEILRVTPFISIESAWKRGVGFLPVEWIPYMPRTGEDSWKNWAMLFWADVELDYTVTLKLLIGPGSKEERERLFRRAQSASFLRTKANPSRKWDTVYKRLFALPAEPSRNVTETLRIFQSEWEEFVKSDLVRLRDWFTEDSLR